MSEFLGIRGISFPLRFDSRGKVAVSIDDQHIKESVMQILLTRKGSVPFKPNFGSEIPTRAFSSVNAKALIRADAEEAIRFWEPRVELLAITLDNPEAVAVGEVHYSVTYRNKVSRQTDSLILPEAT